MVAVFELARSIHSNSAFPHLKPVEGQGGGQRKTQKPEVCLEFIPLIIFTQLNKKKKSQFHSNRETTCYIIQRHTHPKQKQVKNQLYKSKSSKGLNSGDMKPF